MIHCPLSQYFVVSDFNPSFTAGKNSFSINGSPYLLNNSNIYIECIDSNGNNLYIDVAETSDSSGIINNTYKVASTQRLFSIYVFKDTADGVGWIILYGTLTDGKSVKWMQNITINRSLSNTSVVRFYQPPVFDIQSSVVPEVNFSLNSSLVNVLSLEGTGQGLSVNPSKDTIIDTINLINTDIDYRFTAITPVINNSTPDEEGFSSQMIGYTISLNIHSIQSPVLKTIISIQQSASFTIKNVLNNNTLQLNLPFTYPDDLGNNVITNIVEADYSIEYPYISYNNSQNKYETGSISGTSYSLYESFADISFTNIRTFTGYVARYKLYSKELTSNGDFSLVADSPIIPNELLVDDNTLNTYYSSLGIFYNNQHIQNYWHTSSNNLTMSCNPSYAINSMYLSSENPSALNGNDYIIVKNNSSPKNTAAYVPFNETQYLLQTGSAYDSNFILLNANTQYKIIFSAVINKSEYSTAKLDLYFTSSTTESKFENNFTNKFGIKLMELSSSQSGKIIDFTDSYTFYTPQHDLYGTLVIVPTLCTANIKNISLSIFGDDGYSPDTFLTRIPWTVSNANESYQLQAELFDINSNLIYSDLNKIQNFDASGLSLIPNITGSTVGDLTVNNLYVSESLVIAGGFFDMPNIPPRFSLIPYLYQNRLICVGPEGEISYTPITDITADNSHMTLTLGNASDYYDPTAYMQQSLTSQYNGVNSGRKIYFDANGNKIIETGTLI